MNAPTKIVMLDEAVLRATEQANCWRGLMVNRFARGERIVGEALLELDTASKVPTVLKQRADRLRPLIQPKAIEALDAFLELARNRNVLAHGDGRVTVDRKGQWMLRLSYLDREQLTHTTFYEPEANALQVQLRAAIRALESLLKT